MLYEEVKIQGLSPDPFHETLGLLQSKHTNIDAKLLIIVSHVIQKVQIEYKR